MYYIFWLFLGLIISEYIQLISDRGTFIGSLLGRSKCDFCGKNIVWYSLIPLIGPFLSNRKSVCCGKKIPINYFWFELFFVTFWGMVLAAMWYTELPTPLLFGASLFVTSTTALLVYEDYKNYSVPTSWLASWGVSFVAFWLLLGHTKLFWVDTLTMILVLVLSLGIVKFSKKDSASLEFKDMFGLADLLVLILVTLLIGFQAITVIIVATMITSLLFLFAQKRMKLGQQLPMLTTMLPWTLLALILLI